ncbi:MAG: CARDB domain-containing protein [Geobacteraceae bacterium]|nr:CARDB domain-containing protein [Geobacteraceae bacterium]
MKRIGLVRHLWLSATKATIKSVIMMAFIMLSALSSPVLAADFTAKTLGDHGNVSVMEVSGNYDIMNPDGTFNVEPRQVIAREFYKTHKDDYDFLVIFSNFDYSMRDELTKGFYSSVKNDVLGIGKELFDNSALYGSNGMLQGTIDMGNISSKVSDPLDPRFEETLGVLSHEISHRWSAYVSFRDQAGNPSQALLGREASHWSYLLDTRGSLMYGNHWTDNGNDTFTSIAVTKYYSPLDLYLMGMIDKSKVPPMLLIDNPAIDPQRMPEMGATISGTSRLVTIEDIIAAVGERVPSAADSKKSFKTAFIFVTTPGTFTGKELTGIENIRNGFVTRYSILTDGKGLVQVAATPRENLPVNPGVTQPVLDPRTLPPDINEGITWLLGRQQADGSWSDIPLTTERDTAEVVSALRTFSSAGSQYQAGYDWLNRVVSNNTDYLARRIDSLVGAGGNASTLVATLVSLQNPDGGWGSAKSFGSSAGDTALALKALVRAGYGNRELIGRGVAFLKGRRNPDGGWSDGGSSAIRPTTAVLSIFTALKSEFGLDTEVQDATAWLLTKQNPDGGFGCSPSTVYETALAVMALRETGAAIDVTNRGVAYLLGQQSSNGSWSDSPFQTALAVKSVWQATITPDLSLKNGDITLIPERITELPTTAVVSAVIRNLGRTDVPQAKVVIYDGAVAADRKVGEQVLAFPALASVTATFSVPVPDGNSHTFYITVDPDNQVKESDESNNMAGKTLNPELTYDFSVGQGDLSVSENPVGIFKEVRLTARVANRGTSNAYNVQLRFFIDLPGAPYEVATVTADIPAGGSVTREVTWKADKAGADMPLTVQVDPQNTFAELSETNNRASMPLTVTGATLPNLAVSHKDLVVTPNPALERGTASIAVPVKNNGFSTAQNVKVDFYRGVPGSGGVLIGSGTIPALEAGQSQQVAVSWGPIAESGSGAIFVSVDPDKTVAEVAEDDNTAFTQVDVLSLPDLAVTANAIFLNPSAPKEGDTLAINVTVQNSGGQDALNVPVAVKEGSTVVGAQVIPRIAGHGQASVSISYATAGKNGTHEIQVTVDGDNTIVELRKDNNTATKTFGIQNANLWVSEQYISPNGDGVKDSTDFFFRLATPVWVKVQVVNRKGEAVRTFSGGELDSTAGTTVTWDGKRDNGVVARDGDYQFKVLGAAGELLGSLQVVVDTNRSALPEAIGTRYWLQNNLTCSLGDYTVLKWLPDESGVLVQLYGSVLEKGIYRLSPTGEDMKLLMRQGWSDANYDYTLRDYSLSPDGSTVASIIWMRDRVTSVSTYSIWLVDTDGENLRLLYKNADSAMIPDGELAWSPNGKLLSYKFWKLSTKRYTLSYANIETGVNTIVDNAENGNAIDRVAWSRDNSRLSYNIMTDNGSMIVHVSDLAGNKTTVYNAAASGYYYSDLFWYDTGRLIMTYSIYMYSIDTVNNTSEMLSDKLKSYNFNEKYGKLAIVERNVNDELYYYDGSTKQKYHETTKYFKDCIPRLDDIVWSPDGRILAFTDPYFASKDIPVYHTNLVTIDTLTGAKKLTRLIDADETEFDCGLLSYHVYLKKGDSVKEVGVLHYRDAYATQKLDLTPYLAGQAGPVTLRIRQVGLDGANIDHVALEVNGGRFSPVKAVKIATGTDILAKVEAQDGDVAEFHETEAEFVWDQLPAAGRVSLVLNANEVALGSSTVLLNSLAAATSAALTGSSAATKYVGGLQWLGDNENLVAQDSAGLFAISNVDGLKSYLPASGDITDVSPQREYVDYLQDVDETSACYQANSSKGKDYWALGSLLNLVAYLTASKEKSAVVLKGVASDRNFAGYRLEYASAGAPDDWKPVAPASDTPVVNGVFTTWVPPGEGTYYVRLTVWDKAGNTAVKKTRVNWGLSASISNLYKSLENFSPNGDGVRDTVELHYQVLEPAHLEFQVRDEAGTLVRTLLRDYAQPAADSVSWDGRDESGRMAPDGKYSIKVFDYEFFVEVDGSVPGVAVGIGPVTGDIQNNEITAFRVSLLGHATDGNLRQWTLSEGSGDNPSVWTELMNRATPLGATDGTGKSSDAVIESYGVALAQGRNGYEITANTIEWLVGRTMRLDAEDFSGNRKTATSGRLEEILNLAAWDGKLIPVRLTDDKEYVPAHLMRPGVHRLTGFETVRNSLTSLNLQYAVYDTTSRKENWFDDPAAAITGNGNFTMDWDRSHIGSDISAVRLKGTDSGGNVYYSKRYPQEEMFLVSCAGMAMNNLYGRLATLEFQLKSDNDERYVNWTRVRFFDSSTGDAIPEGSFAAPLQSDLFRVDGKYSLRMIGIASDGTRYDVQISLSCMNQSSVPNLLVDYPAGECGTVQSKAVLTLSAGNLGGYLGSADYYLKKNDTFQLIRHVDQSTEAVTVDTAVLAEGNYPVRAVLRFFNPKTMTEESAEASNTLVVDRVLPEARITYPSGNGLNICPVQTDEPEGPWFSILPEGVAQDNLGVVKYELYYGTGANPSTWTAALSKVRDEAGWPAAAPIAGTGPLRGSVGKWDISGMRGGETYAFSLKVTDKAGNVSCGASAPFTFDSAVDIPPLVLDRAVFSPAGEAASRLASATFTINESASVDARAYRVVGDSSLTLDTTPVKTLLSGKLHLSGSETVTWDGSSDSGGTVPDGRYGLAVFASDSCRNVNRNWIPVEVDGTPPTVTLDYPKQGDTLPPGNIIEVKGKALDLHFSSYALEAGAGASPTAWQTIASGKNSMVAVNNGSTILGSWNTFDRAGIWTLRLTARDVAGNTGSVLSTVDLGARKTLVKEFNASPVLFSPNNDGRLDTAALSFEVTDACGIRVEILDSNDTVIREFSGNTPAAGVGSHVWDGKDRTGAPVKDGDYRARLTATLASNPAVSQTELITVTLDAAPPAIDIRQPADNAYLNQGEITVFGSITDQHLAAYTATVTGPDGMSVLESGSQNRESVALGAVSNLREDRYTLNLEAKDQGETATRLTRAFFIDRTPPKASLAAPATGRYFGGSGNVIDITGAIVEKNLARYALRYGTGETPSEWKEVVNGDSIPTAAKLYSWKVGKDDGVPDGEYILSLLARDRAGLEGEARVKVTVDNTPPVTIIAAPVDGAWIRGSFDVRGTASDANLDMRTLELSEGACPVAVKWVTLKTAFTPVTDGVITSFKEIPADGAYCLRLAASDKTGNRTETRTNMNIDRTPPAAPVLTGKATGTRAGASLNWTRNGESDLAGYNLYRNNVKLNPSVLGDVVYQDEGLAEGAYEYSVKAIDKAGNESTQSNTVKIAIDRTGPSVRISTPADGSRVGNQLEIRGTAYSSDDFREYRVAIGRGVAPTTWTVIRTSPLSVSFGTLASWDTFPLQNGESYVVRLEAEDLSGNVATTRSTVTIDNSPPARPALLAANPSGASVSLSWQANSEPDLAGYLLYRNGQLANFSGVVVGNLKPYLLTGASYVNSALPDGRHVYYLVAVDQAGNLSEPSTTLEVNLDNRRPHAVIIDPADGAKLDGRSLVRADSPDTDITSVQFQYRHVQDTAWTSLGAPVTGAQPAAYFDPKAMGLAFGDYQLMAVARDGGGPDPAPAFVTVSYTELTPPAVPTGLSARTTGNAVTLAWNADTESDLDGYSVYRTVGSVRTRVNASLLKTPSYLDSDLADGEYAYEVTAIDTFGNESRPSATVGALVYTPVLQQPFTPTGKSGVRIEGGGAPANASVELLLDNPAGHSSAGKAAADPQGAYAMDNVVLALGENRITATATDAEGNTGRTSNTVVVVYNDTPSAPVNLVGDVQDQTVNLRWDTANTDPEVIGYNVFRDGVKLNLPTAVAGGVPAASSSLTDWSSYPYKTFSPSLALDGNPATTWRGQFQAGRDNWWEVVLPQPELLNHLAIQWGTQTDATGSETVYGARDYEVLAWSGYAWIPLAKVTGNAGRENSFDFVPSYRTDRVRIHVTTAMSAQMWIAEVGMLKDNLVTANSYQSEENRDKKYGYRVSAVDKYGFESPRSEESSVAVGDVVPPANPGGLTATAVGSDVTLDWSVTPNGEPDLAGYLVYRRTGEEWTRLTPDPVTGTSYPDAQRPNGSYTYRITAVDMAGNESGPSNEATANVAVGLQAAPVITGARSLTSGQIEITWTCQATEKAGFNVYRATTAGGPYAKVGSLPADGASVADSGVTSGTTYYYVVRVVDGLGNESRDSNEAAAVSLDTDPPVKPAIVAPALPGTPVTLRRATVAVSGTAEADSTLELFRNGVSVGRTVASVPTEIKGMPLNFPTFDTSLSPDGSALLYADNDDIWLLTLATGRSERIVAKGIYPSWFADGKKFGYLSYDDLNNYRVGVFDTSTGATLFATGDTEPYEDYPSWSAEGDRVAFLREIDGVTGLWVKDFVSGDLTRVPRDSTTYSLSPDGSRLAFFEDLGLSILDLATGTITPVSGTTDGSTVSWSPDGRMLLYSSWLNDAYAVHVFDTSARTAHPVTEAGGYVYFPAWSPGGARIVYGRGSAGGGYAILAADLQGAVTRLADSLPEVSDIKWAEPGTLVYVGSDTLSSIAVQPQFRFVGVTLEIGDNTMDVVSTDQAGNLSPRSDSIIVRYDTSRMPDVAVAARDILVYPPNPKPGAEVLARAVVRNPGLVDLENVPVEIHLWDQAGELKILKSDLIPHLAAGAEETVEVSFTAGAVPGTNFIIVMADPADAVRESSESNNNATADFYVAGKEELLMATAVAQAGYGSGQDVGISVELRNTGPVVAGRLSVNIEDEAGNVVVQKDSRELSLAYGAKETLNYAWNTGATLAGAYRVHSVLTGTSGVLVENLASFAISPDNALEMRAGTDRSTYRSRESVTVSVHLKNAGANGIFQRLSVKTKILDSTGREMFTDSREVPSLLPGADASLSASWNSGLSVPGGYRALVEVYLGETLLKTAESSFTIVPDTAVSGTVSVEPAVVVIGKDFSVSFAVGNNGNADADGVLLLSLTDPDSREVLETREQPFLLPVNTTLNGMFSFGSGTLGLKSYQVTLQRKTGETLTTLAGASVTVQDVTPPTVSILSPEQGSMNLGAVKLQALVFDDASGVERVEYRLDSDPWRLLPATDLLQGKYLAVWEPTAGSSGEHTLSCRAFDNKGNGSEPVATSFTVRFDNTPPVLVLSTLSDGARTNQVALNVTGTVQDDTGVREVSINGEYAAVNPDGSFTHALLLVAGENRITTIAYDLAGNRAEDTRTIVLDLEAPNLTVTTPPDNLKTGEQTVTISGSVDESCSVEVKLNGTSIYAGTFSGEFSTTTLLIPGLNHIEVTASDMAGNSSSVKRSVFYDSQKPTLVITEPSQDISTNRNSITIMGSVGDDSGNAAVTVSVDGTTFTPTLVDGAFSQTVDFTGEKLYEIIVTATDGIAGHEVSTQRNIIYDVTKPVLTIDPVISPVSETSQVISGTREERALVTVTCSTATVGAIAYPTPTTWSVPLAGLTSGENVINAASSDAAGNQATESASIIVQVEADDLVLIPFPGVLWPPNHKKYPVLLAGWIRHPCHTDIVSVDISVEDEYGVYNYTNLHLNSIVRLESWRKGDDKDGRIYKVTAVATHRDGRKTTTVRRVIVPHDMSKCDGVWDRLFP